MTGQKTDRDRITLDLHIRLGRAKAIKRQVGEIFPIPWHNIKVINIIQLKL